MDNISIGSCVQSTDVVYSQAVSESKDNVSSESFNKTLNKYSNNIALENKNTEQSNDTKTANDKNDVSTKDTLKSKESDNNGISKPQENAKKTDKSDIKDVLESLNDSSDEKFNISDLNYALSLLQQLLSGSTSIDKIIKENSKVSASGEVVVSDNAKKALKLLEKLCIKTSVNVSDAKENKNKNNIAGLKSDLLKLFSDSDKNDNINTTKISLNVTNVEQVKVLKDAISTLIEKINNQMSKGDKKAVDTNTQNISSSSDIIKSIVKLISDKNESENVKNTFNVLDTNYDSKKMLTVLDEQPQNKIVDIGSSSNKSNLSDNQNLNKNSSSDEKVLKNLVASDKDDSKINKTVNFMSQFTNSAVNNNDTQNNLITAEKLDVNKYNATNDILKTVKYMENNDIKSLTVKMVPKELGELSIKVSMENGVMKASISASNKDAYNIINSNISEISSKLSDMDIKIQNITIDIYNEDTTFFSNQNNNEHEGNSNKQKNKVSKLEGIGELDDSEKDILDLFSKLNILA